MREKKDCTNMHIRSNYASSSDLNKCISNWEKKIYRNVIAIGLFFFFKSVSLCKYVTGPLRWNCFSGLPLTADYPRCQWLSLNLDWVSIR